MKPYEKTSLEIIAFETVDIINTSGPISPDNLTEGIDVGWTLSE